jgi:hypothetical protein
MALVGVVWVTDTSSIIEVRRATTVAVRPKTFAGMTKLVSEGRLVFPAEVLEELKRNTDPKAPDEQFKWANDNSGKAHAGAKCDLNDVKAVLKEVPTVLDPAKDSGAEEADPYVLAVARKLRAQGIDARIITQDIRDTPSKMSLSSAAGLLGIPCVPLRAFLTAESIPSS